MNQTIVGRVTALRGLRDQVEIYYRRATTLGNWTPIAVVVLLYLFRKSYLAERQAMNEERTRDLRSEKAMFERAERGLR